MYIYVDILSVIPTTECYRPITQKARLSIPTRTPSRNQSHSPTLPYP